jgi:chemotaxis family two-component system response regulator Rcp1
VARLGNGRTGEFRGAFRTPENVGVEDGALQERERASRDIRRQVSRAENRASTSDWRYPWGPVDRWRRAVMSDRPNTEPIEILLVEDNPGDARLAVEALKESKVSNRLHYVADGVEAMRFLRREGEYAGVAVPDLILLDLNLPRKDGREVLEEIKEDPQLRLIPVVILTTSAAERDLVKSYGLHANAYVVKPIDLDRFIEIVKAIEGFWFYIVKLPQDLDG